MEAAEGLKSASVESPSTACNASSQSLWHDLPRRELGVNRLAKKSRTRTKKPGYSFQQRKVLCVAFKEGYLSNSNHHGPLSLITGLSGKQISNWARKRIEKCAKHEVPKENSAPLSAIFEHLVYIMRKKSKIIRNKHVKGRTVNPKDTGSSISPDVLSVTFRKHNCRNSPQFTNKSYLYLVASNFIAKRWYEYAATATTNSDRASALAVADFYSRRWYETYGSTISACGIESGIPTNANLSGMQAAPNTTSLLSTVMGGCGLPSSSGEKCIITNEPEVCHTNEISNEIACYIEYALHGLSEVNDQTIHLLANIALLEVDTIMHYLLHHGWACVTRPSTEEPCYSRC